LIFLLQEKISVMPSRRLRQLTKRTWPTASAWLKPVFGRMQLKRWLTSTNSCQLLREVPFAREPAHTTSRVMLRSTKIKSRMYMEKRQQACSRLLRPTSWPIQMPKYENSHIWWSFWCGLFVCFFLSFFSLALAVVWQMLFLLFLDKFFSALIVFDFVVICMEAFLLSYCIVCNIHNKKLFVSLYIFWEDLSLWNFLLFPFFFK